MTRAIVALGGNLGDPVATIDAALEALAALDGIHIVTVSRYYSSLAHTVDGVDRSARYVNAVASIESVLEPVTLLEGMLGIERQLGRPSEHGHWQPRTIDLDLVCFGAELIDTPELTLPHPRAHERVFVLQPWFEIDPQATLAGVPIATLLESCDPEERAALTLIEEAA